MRSHVALLLASLLCLQAAIATTDDTLTDGAERQNVDEEPLEVRGVGLGRGARKAGPASSSHHVDGSDRPGPSSEISDSPTEHPIVGKARDDGSSDSEPTVIGDDEVRGNDVSNMPKQSSVRPPPPSKTSPPKKEELAEMDCPPLIIPPNGAVRTPDSWGGMYPKSDCVYPQTADHPNNFYLDNLGGVENDLTAEYKRVREEFVKKDRDVFYDKPRKVFKKQWAWDNVQNGRTVNPEQEVRRINRFKHKNQFFVDQRDVKNFFDIDGNMPEACADAFIRYTRHHEEFEHDTKTGDSNGRRVLRRVHAPAHVFFHPGIRKKIDNSKMFSIAKRFPKGAILHSHFWSLSSAEFMARMMVDPSMTKSNWAINDPSFSSEDAIYNGAYQAALKDIEDMDVKRILQDKDGELRKSLYVCGTIDELLGSTSFEDLFDANKHREASSAAGTRRDCQVYERKPGNKPEPDGDFVPVGTMAFFPVNPNPANRRDCLYHDGEDCRNLEIALFNLNPNDPANMSGIKNHVKGDKLAKVGGWHNLVEQLENPVIQERLLHEREKAKAKAHKLGVFCPEGCHPDSDLRNPPMDMEGLSWFLEGPPERLVLLSYFQMGYWDWHPLVQSRELWEKLEATWARTGNVAKFLPFFHLYVLDTQRRLLKDNVQVLEARHKPGALYMYRNAAGNTRLEEKLQPLDELKLIDSLVSSMNQNVKRSTDTEWDDAARSHLNQAKIKVIAFERRIGQTMGPAQATKMAQTLRAPINGSPNHQDYGLLTQDVSRPCGLKGGRLNFFGKSDGSGSGCGMLAGIDYAGEEAAFYYYGLGNNRDVARHFFFNMKKANQVMSPTKYKFHEIFINPHHSGEANNVENYNMFDSYITQAANGYGEPDTGHGQHQQGRPMRFGHGIALEKFPTLEKLLLGSKFNPPNVLIEVNPISNQVLGYVPDLRNHPGLNQMRRGLAIALSFDDPSQFGYSDVSYDWYQALVAWKIDLSDMKELALNSIAFSSLTFPEQAEVFQMWSKRYTRFLQQIVDEARSLLLSNREEIEAKLHYYYQHTTAEGIDDPLLIEVYEKCKNIPEDWEGSFTSSKMKARSPFKKILASLFPERTQKTPEELKRLGHVER